ncbi:MAG: hypothetical protein R3304_00825 [Longimicrobiales bacterium]|nr:hypothetical protein [Longimicrobiales bacterium]
MSRIILTVAAGLWLVGCASGTARSDADPFTESEAPSSITIMVMNRNFADARLYALRRGQRQSLGVVSGLTDYEFTLEWNFSEPLQLEIDMVAGPQCRTRAIQADPGDVFEFQIASVFTESQACR